MKNFAELKDCSRDKEIYLFGLGKICERFLIKYEKEYTIAGIFDNNVKNQGITYQGYKTMSPELFSTLDKSKTVVIITCAFVKEIEEQLEKLGVIYIFSAHLEEYERRGLLRPFKEFTQEQLKKLDEVKDLLVDTYSKEILDTIIHIRKDSLMYDWYKICENKQYFCKDVLQFGEEEVFVDGGSYNGDTITQFSKTVSGKYKHVYAFEPDYEPYLDMCKLAGEDSRITPINKGLWSLAAEQSFLLEDHGSSRIVNEGEGVVTIQLAAIDEEVKEKVTFIKMDVEGAEMEALHGAKNTIQRDKPKLAISVYHKPEDIIQIPLYIKELVPEYRFYLRHHSPGRTETVIYAQV